MKRLGLALAAMIVAACGTEPRSHSGNASAGLPFADHPGTEYAPRYSPPPSPRGVAPPRSSIRALSAKAGPVCGDSRIVGVEIAPIRGSKSGCGIARPVRVAQISGVALTSPIRVNCPTAKTFADWVDDSVKPAARQDVGADIRSIKTIASYSCRTRNSRPGARLSEHAKGNAVDIAGFAFADGTQATVLNGFEASGGRGDFLRKVWRRACGTFGTVLGPRSDRFHRDHFHLDIARHIGGPYCR